MKIISKNKAGKGLMMVGSILTAIGWGPVIFFLCLGKALRYVAVAVATVQGMMWWH